MSWFHLHYAGIMQENGIYAYYECRCGARRTQRVVYNLMGTIKPGWPKILFGQYDSGWVK